MKLSVESNIRKILKYNILKLIVLVFFINPFSSIAQTKGSYGTLRGITYYMWQTNKGSLIAGISEADSNLTSVVIPKTVTYNGKQYEVLKIFGEAFMNCNKLEKIVIPDNVNYIGIRAFAGCSSLSEFEMPYELRYLEEEAFAYCDKLRRIKLPPGIKEIGQGVFEGCRRLIYVDLPSDLKEITADMFADCRSLDEITIPHSCTKIGEYAFAGCPLRIINIPASVTIIDRAAFSGCRKLIHVACSNPDPKSYSPNAFSYTQYSRTLTIPWNSYREYEELWSEYFHIIEPIK